MTTPAAAAADDGSSPGPTGPGLLLGEAEPHDGRPLRLGDPRGRVVVVVNTAGRCGFTERCEGFEALPRCHRADGLTVLGVPSNDFGGQGPGTPARSPSSASRTTG